MKLLDNLKNIKGIKLSKKQKVWIGVLLLIIAAITAVFLIGRQQGWFAILESEESLKEYVASFGVWAPLAFFVLQFFAVIISPIPSNVTSFVSGMVFGFFYGFLLTFTAVFLGSICAFLLGKFFGRPLVERIASKQTVEKYFNTVSLRQRVMLILMFLFPFFPDDLICMIAGLTSMRLSSFALIVLLTRPWGLVVSSFLGSNAISLPSWIWIVVASFTFIIIVLAIKYTPHIEERVRIWMEKKYNKTS